MSDISGVSGDVRFGGRDSVTGKGEKEDWRTPSDLLAQIIKKWGTDYDPAPYPRPAWDGLKVDWLSRVFFNPPYGRETPRWIAKAVNEIRIGHTEIAVALLFVRSDTRWFHEMVMRHASEIWFILDRCYFVDSLGKGRRAPMASMLVVFEKGKSGRPSIHTWHLPERSRKGSLRNRKLEAFST